MTAIGDVVRLRDGSVGVVGGEVPSPGPQVYRVYFPNEHATALEADISATLAAPVYNVGETVTLWPYSGEITAIDGDEFTLSIERQTVFDFGPISWTAEYKAPLWRIIRDNDERLERL